jgi:hypothetical protein
MDFPRTVEEITPEWLTRVLRESGAIEGARVESIDASSLGEDSGVTAAIHLLNVGYDFIEENAPQKIVAKHPTEDFDPNVTPIFVKTLHGKRVSTEN